MPRPGQIIPLYTQPHYEVYINDNTTYTPDVPIVENGIRVGFVFTSGRGQDNVLLKKRNTTEYLAEYGVPNYKLYGQPGYMPYSGLKSKVTTAYCMRVMPADATYANMILVAVCKWVEKIPSWDPLGQPRKVMEVYYEARAQRGIVSDLSVLEETMREIELESDDTHLVKPICAFYSLGRGLYGNDFSIRMSSDIQSNKANNIASYNVIVNTKNNPYAGQEVKAEISLYDDANVNNTSLYIADVMNDPDNGSSYVGVIGNEGALDVITEYYNAVTETPIDVAQFDIITGIDINTRKRYVDVDVLTLASSVRITGYLLTNTGAKLLTDQDQAILYDKIDPDAAPISITSEDGLPLIFGTEGAFDIKMPAATREAAITKAYIDAFMGKLDKSIKSTRRTPMDYLMDANYPKDVKLVLQHLVTSRGDCQGHIDCGFLNTETEVKNYVNDVVIGNGNRLFSYDVTNLNVKDPFSGKKMRVTYTYDMVNNLTVHQDANGINVPFVGSDSTLTDFIKNSILPEVDADDKEFKEFLVVNKVNYVEAVGENRYQRGVQGTSQLINSDLSEENNMRITLHCKRELETLVSEVSYDFTKADNIRLFTENAERRLAKYKSMVETLNVRFGMTELERARNILHCYLELTFNPMAKISIIEIDINPRV